MGESKPATTDSPAASGPSRPTLLCPPATIISPPSPVDHTGSQAASQSIPQYTPDDDDRSEYLAYDSPEEDNDNENTLSPVTSRQFQRNHSMDSQSSSRQHPLAATQLSTSPAREPSLLAPYSPGSSPSATPLSRNDSQLPVHPRAPSPSSPHFRPKPSHHRRTSSTHRVRETIGGEQRDTEDGRMVNQYKIGKSLGSGAYAKVELGLDVKTGKQYAIKEFSTSRLKCQALQQRQKESSRARLRRPRPGDTPSCKPAVDKPANDTGPWGEPEMKDPESDPLGLIRREIAVMKKLDHPNIVVLYEAIAVPDADALFLVLEYLSGGVLMEVAMGPAAVEAKAPFDTWQTREYFRQLCLGLEYLHANGVVHRDIKPENILLSSDRSTVKLCDFGVSEMFDAKGDDRIKKAGGSPAFLSPESLASSNDIHGPAVDVWALGVTLYCMLTGKLPFNIENPIELFEAVKTREPEIIETWDEGLKDLLTGMFKKDPHVRTTVSTIREHRWVTENGAQPMIPREDNLYYIGKEVEEPTQDEMRKAIGSLHRMFTVVRAVQKMRRLQLHRRSMSNQSSAGSTPNSSPMPLAPSRGASTDLSMNSGSMDSYASIPGGTSTTSNTDTEDKWKGLAAEETLSPNSIDSPQISPGGTERQDSDSNPFDKLKPIKTDIKPEQKENETDQDVVLFASPTSDT